MFNRLNTFISGHVVLNQVPSSIPNETDFIVYQMEPHGMGYAYNIHKVLNSELLIDFVTNLFGSRYAMAT